MTHRRVREAPMLQHLPQRVDRARRQRVLVRIDPHNHHDLLSSPSAGTASQVGTVLRNHALGKQPTGGHSRLLSSDTHRARTPGGEAITIKATNPSNRGKGTVSRAIPTRDLTPPIQTRMASGQSTSRTVQALTSALPYTYIYAQDPLRRGPLIPGHQPAATNQPPSLPPRSSPLNVPGRRVPGSPLPTAHCRPPSPRVSTVHCRKFDRAVRRQIRD